jgi:hypothetical protein
VRRHGHRDPRLAGVRGEEECDSMNRLPKLWKATVIYEVYVLAHDPAEAVDYARLSSDCYVDIQHTSKGTAVRVRQSDVPKKDLDTLPWIAADVKNPDHMEDITVSEWLERIKKEEV